MHKVNQKLKPDKSSFGLMHVNIASLDAHIDDLRTALSRLQFDFDIIGVSEHKIHEDGAPSNNIDIQGYQNFDYTPTSTAYGGCGFFVKLGLDYIPRKDLNVNSPGICEAHFIELLLPDRKNLIVTVFIDIMLSRSGNLILPYLN